MEGVKVHIDANFTYLKSSVFRDKTPSISACCLLHANFLFGLIVDPEVGGDMFLGIVR
jgi:hypothetical protein